MTTLAPAGDVLEVGAGDGFLATALLTASPGLTYLGIDIAPTPGRLFQGDSAAASFASMPLSDLPTDQAFDLVLLSDVLHHVVDPQRCGLIAAAWAHVRAGGALAIKEWERRRNIPHAMAVVSDRYISGDRQVSFASREELLALVARAIGRIDDVSEARIPPMRNNLLVVLRKLAIPTV